MNRMQPEAHTLTAAYVCDALDPAERAAFDAHLEACPACRQEVMELREVVAALGMAAAAAPPEQLKAAVNARVAVTRQLPPKVTPLAAALGAARGGGRRQRYPRRARAGWIVAAALAGVVAGQAVYTVQQRGQFDSVSQRADAMTQLLTSPDAHSSAGTVSTGGSALVVDSRRLDEAAISLSGLAAPPAGKAYQLWMIGPGTTVRSGGVVTLAGGATGPVIAHGLDGAKTVGLTVEPAKGSTQPTSSPILLVPMS